MTKARYTALFLVLVMALPLYADFAKLGTSGAQFLKISVGRGAAMGEAFVAVADDASATYWNPSGLGMLMNREITFQHNEWIADIRHEYLSAVLPFGNFGTMGISLTVLTMGQFEYTAVDDPNTTIREDSGGTGTYFNASDFALAFSFGRMFTDRLAAGVTVKAVQEMVWDMTASGFAVDFGMHYNTGFKGLRIAASMSNFGADIGFGGGRLVVATDPGYDNTLDYDPIPVEERTTPYPMPLVFRFGVAFNPIENESSKLTMAFDLNHPNDNYETLNLGLEYGYLNTVFLRLGYKAYLNMDYLKAMTGGDPIIDTVENEITGYEWGDNTEWLLNNLTAGVGFNLKRGHSNLMVDYTYMNKGILKATHRLGLTIGF
jgi:hypothetical protein